MDFNWQDVFEIFKKPNVHKEMKIIFPKIDEERVKKILVSEHDFSMERIENALAKLHTVKKQSAQRTLF